MKKLITVSMGLLLSTALLFTACKKNNKDAVTDSITESQVQSDDQAAVAAQTDDISTDASTVVENVIAVSGRGPLNYFAPPCNAAITYDTLNAAKTITITYNGVNCAGTLTRTGVVTISIPAGVEWKNQGAQLTITSTNLKITRMRDQKSITVNGSEVITNVTGGLLRNLAAIGAVTHTITSPGITVSFDNGTQRSWQVARQRLFSYNNGIVISTTGTHTEGTATGISEWGTNRFGNNFITQITDPVVIRQDCNFRVTGGHVKHSGTFRTVDVIFGLDISGNPTGCPGLGAYYMKIMWVNVSGTATTVILPY